MDTKTDYEDLKQHLKEGNLIYFYEDAKGEYFNVNQGNDGSELFYNRFMRFEFKNKTIIKYSYGYNNKRMMGAMAIEDVKKVLEVCALEES